MNLSGLMDTLQLFLTEYNYVGCFSFPIVVKINIFLRNRWVRWGASTFGGGVTSVLSGKVEKVQLKKGTNSEIPVNFRSCSN